MDTVISMLSSTWKISNESGMQQAHKLFSDKTVSVQVREVQGTGYKIDASLH